MEVKCPGVPKPWGKSHGVPAPTPNTRRGPPQIMGQDQGDPSTPKLWGINPGLPAPPCASTLTLVPPQEDTGTKFFGTRTPPRGQWGSLPASGHRGGAAGCAGARGSAAPHRGGAGRRRVPRAASPSRAAATTGSSARRAPAGSAPTQHHAPALRGRSTSGTVPPGSPPCPFSCPRGVPAPGVSPHAIVAAPGCPLGVPSCHGGGTRVSPRAITVAPGCPSTTPSTWAVPSVSPHAPGAAFGAPSVSPPILSPPPSASPSSTERRRRSAWKSAGKQERTLSCRQSPANTPRHRLSTAMSATWGGGDKGRTG